MRVVLLLGFSLLFPVAAAAPTGEMTAVDGAGAHFAEPFVPPSADAVTLHLVLPWRPAASVPNQPAAAGYSTASLTFAPSHVGDDLAAAVTGAALCPVSAAAADMLAWRACVPLREAAAPCDVFAMEANEYCVDAAPAALPGLAPVPPLTLAVELAVRTTELSLVLELSLLGAVTPGESEPLTARVHNQAWSVPQFVAQDVAFTIAEAGLSPACKPQLTHQDGAEVEVDPLGCARSAGYPLCDPLDADCAPGPSCAASTFGCLNAPHGAATEVVNPTAGLPAAAAQELGQNAPRAGLAPSEDRLVLVSDGAEVATLPFTLPYRLSGSDHSDAELLLRGDILSGRVCLSALAGGDPLAGGARDLRCGGDMDGDGDPDFHELNLLRNPLRDGRAGDDRLVPLPGGP